MRKCEDPLNSNVDLILSYLISLPPMQALTATLKRDMQPNPIKPNRTSLFFSMRWSFSRSLPSNPSSPSLSSYSDLNPNPDPDMENSPDSNAHHAQPDARIRRHLKTEVSKNHADLLLLVCCLVSGLVDSTIYNGMVR